MGGRKCRYEVFKLVGRSDPWQVFSLTEKLVYSIIKNGMKDYTALVKTDLKWKGNNFSLPNYRSNMMSLLELGKN